MALATAHAASTRRGARRPVRSFADLPIALHLPVEMWQEISDFLQCALISYTCRRLWVYLARRHLTVHLSGQNVEEVIAPLRTDSAIHTLVLRCKGLDATGAQVLATLRDAPSLRSLDLCLAGNSVGPEGAKALAQLKAARCLKDLKLNLLGNNVGDAGALALAALKESPTLSTLSLDLWWNSVGDEGAQALAALKDMPSLRVLSLSLVSVWYFESNDVGMAGAQALATLKEAPKLDRLGLQLPRKNLGVRGLHDLAALKNVRQLKSVDLILWSFDNREESWQFFSEPIEKAIPILPPTPLGLPDLSPSSLDW